MHAPQTHTHIHTHSHTNQHRYFRPERVLKTTKSKLFAGCRDRRPTERQRRRQACRCNWIPRYNHCAQPVPFSVSTVIPSVSSGPIYAKKMSNIFRRLQTPLLTLSFLWRFEFLLLVDDDVCTALHLEHLDEICICRYHIVPKFV